jgi:hypothetical protein
MTYMLEGQSKELRDHINQEVQVTGKLDSKSGSGMTSSGGSSTTGTTAGGTTTGTTSTGTTAGGTTSGSTTSGSAGMNGPRLKVDSVRMIAASCSSR